MSLITWPTGLVAVSFSLRLLTTQRAYGSPFGGSEQTIDLVNDRWAASLDLQPMIEAQGGMIDGFLSSLRGQTNTVNLWHMSRPAPLGTVRGTPVVNGAHSQGAATVAMTTTAGATLKQGDMLGIAGLLLMVASDCAADGAGAISVPIANRLRTALSDAAAVTWNAPVAPFRKVNAPGLGYAGGIANSVSLEFVEAVS